MKEIGRKRWLIMYQKKHFCRQRFIFFSFTAQQQKQKHDFTFAIIIEIRIETYLQKRYESTVQKYPDFGFERPHFQNMHENNNSLVSIIKVDSVNLMDWLEYFSRRHKYLLYIMLQK